MKTKVQLSFMMFVEWFIWGAWFVPLWLWLSKSGFTAGEIGWSYACTAIAAILSPILVGSLTDRFFAAQKVLAVLMFAGAILMYFAAQQTQFSTFFPLLLAYSLTYMPTIALTNSIAFANVDDVEADFPRIRVMGTIGWIASGLACGFLPQMMGYSDISDTNIPLLMTAASSLLLGVFALFLPNTPPKSTGKLDFKVMLGLLVAGGRKLITPLRAKSALMARLRQGAGVMMLAAVAFNASGMTSALKGANGVADQLENALLSLAQPTSTQMKLQPVADAMPSSQLPSLRGGTGWVNGDPVTSESLRGKVVLIDFWTWDCINCQHTLPHVRDWAKKYQSEGLVVIGVHTPEYPWEKPLSSVKNAVNKWQLPYRVVTDNNYKIWSVFGNQYWPAHYYFDAKGQLRYTAFGEGNYDKQEAVIQQLLKEARS